MSDDVPLLRVVRGEPTAEELTALTVVLVARAAAARTAPAGPPPVPSPWGDQSALLRRPLRPGPGAWRASAWPR